MAVEAHCLLVPVRGRGVADPTETKQKHGDLASTPHDAVRPPAYATEVESGAAFFANADASSRKRARVEEQGQFVGAAKRRVIDVHPVVLRHVQKLNAEVQQWRRHAALANAAVARQLRAKDEEIVTARWLNLLLQEQARAAHAEARAWRDAAASSDAAAAALRADLDHALRSQARDARDGDAESCCSSNSNNGEGGDGGSSVAGACHGCGERDAAARACPACGLPKAGRVTVNLA